MALGSDLPLGPFLVDATGRLRPRRPDSTPGSTVRWRGQLLRARLHDGMLAIEATLGRVPSSAGGSAGRPGQRERTFAALRALPASLPPCWRLCVAPDHRVRIEAEQTMETPPTAVQLVPEVTRFLLLLDPMLSRLDDAGMAPNPAPDTAG